MKLQSVVPTDNLPLRSALVLGVMLLLCVILTNPVAAQVGCVDELAIDIYGPDASVMSTVTVPKGATLEAEVVFRRMIYTAGAVGIDVRISPLRSDGFPERRIKTSGFASPYNTWTTGDNPGGTFRFTNDTNGTQFILELGYIATRTADQEDGLSAALKFFRINGGAACASAHTAPDLPTPTLTCATMPTVHVGGPVVYTEPFDMTPGETLWMKILDHLPMRYDLNGNAVPYGKWFEYEFGSTITLQGRTLGGPWTDIRSRSRLTQSRSWGREAYLSSPIGLQYTFTGILFSDFRVKLVSNSTQPIAGSSKIFSAWIWDGDRSELVCLQSTQTTVAWDTRTSCASDNTRQIRGYVTNKSSSTNAYQIKLFHPTTGAIVHASHSQNVGAGKTGKVSLGGIPAGRWLVRMYQNGIPIGIAYHHNFEEEICSTRVEWAEEPSCAANHTFRIEAQVTNNSANWVDYRIKLFNPATGLVIHASRGHNVAAGQTATVVLEGIRPGTWDAQIFRDVLWPVGSPKTVTFEEDPGAKAGVCDVAPFTKQCFDADGIGVLSPLATAVAQAVLQPDIMEHSSVSADLMISGCNTIPDGGILIRGPEIYNEARRLIATADHEVIIQTFSWESDSYAVSQFGKGLQQAQDNLNYNEKLTVRILGPDHHLPEGRLPDGLSDNPEWQTLDMDKFTFYYGVGGDIAANVHHDKTIIVDGVSMILTGANPQNNNNPGVAWYDIGVRINGPAVQAAVANFDHFWRSSVLISQYLCFSLTSNCLLMNRSDAPIERNWRAKIPSTTGNVWTVALSRLNSGATIFLDDIENPQDKAWTTVLETVPSGSNVSIMSPNINDNVFRDSVVDATQRGVNVRILTGFGFNWAAQTLDGGRNCAIVADLYSRTSSNLWIRWHTHDGQVVDGNGAHQTHAKFMAVTDVSGGGVLAIVGSGNQDTQSWDRSHEYNVLLDGRSTTDRLMLEAFTPVWNAGIAAQSGDCPSTKPGGR